MKKNNKLLISTGVVACMISLTAIFAFRQQAQNRNQSQDDPPTPVRKGIMSDKQRSHSRLYEPAGKPGKDLVKNAHKANENLVIYMPGDANLPVDGRPIPSQTEIIRQNTCDSNVVVVGKVLSKNSQLTERARYVFTDYEIALVDVLRNGLPVNLQPTNQIVVTELGGHVEAENRRINFIVKSKKRLKVNGVYLLFLKYLPSADSYQTLKREGIYEILGNNLRRHSDYPPAYIIADERTDTFLSSVRYAASQCVGKGE